VALAGCDLSNDQALDGRPLTLEYITQTILKPSCGTAECHSALKAEKTDVFDSVAGARASMKNNFLVFTCETLEPPETFPCGNDAAANSYLLTVITDQTTNGYRMPFDQPLSKSNIELIGNWITDTNAAGLLDGTN
jgi:hypothetical protein